MKCEFCLNHEQGDTLYEPSDWDGGIGFDYIRDIKYCPLCGRKLDSEDEPNSSEKPNNCETCEHWNDTEDGCADRHGCKTEPQTVQPCDGCEYSKPYIEYKCTHHSCKYEDEPMTDCGDFANRLAYERGVKHAWEVAQKVFDSTLTFYEAEDVAKQITKGEPQTDCPWK